MTWLQESRGGEGSGLEREDHPWFLLAQMWNAESAKQQRRCDHVADSSRFELRPVFALDATVELCEYLAAKFREDRGERFRGQVRPQLMGLAEQSHEGAGLSVHMEHAAGRGEDNHASFIVGRKGSPGRGVMRID